jgi:hypothetical protein
MNATPLYLAIVEQIRRQILRREWTMWKCDDRSGVQDGYTAKMIHPNTPSGRQARWHTLQDLLEALFPAGMTVELTEISPAAPIEMVHWDRMQSALDVFFPAGLEVAIKPPITSLRPAGRIPVLLAHGSKDASAKMNAMRTLRLSPERRRRMAQRAARARWRRARQARGNARQAIPAAVG